MLVETLKNLEGTIIGAQVEVSGCHATHAYGWLYGDQEGDKKHDGLDIL